MKHQDVDIACKDNIYNQAVILIENRFTLMGDVNIK